MEIFKNRFFYYSKIAFIFITLQKKVGTKDLQICCHRFEQFWEGILLENCLKTQLVGFGWADVLGFRVRNLAAHSLKVAFLG